jgi:toxin-antitoxin system PIN domain toxin
VISVDTNILLYAYNQDCQEHRPAFDFLTAYSERDDVALCELVLVELYILLRNPTVIAEPLSAEEAADACGAYRRHPRWRLLDNAPVMDRVWTKGDIGAANSDGGNTTQRGHCESRLPPY